MIRRAGVEDAAGLIPLIREFYDIDGHPYDAERVESGLMPLLRDDRYGHVWIATSDDDSTLGYAVVTWSCAGVRRPRLHSRRDIRPRPR